MSKYLVLNVELHIPVGDDYTKDCMPPETDVAACDAYAREFVDVPEGGEVHLITAALFNEEGYAHLKETQEFLDQMVYQAVKASGFGDGGTDPETMN